MPGGDGGVPQGMTLQDLWAKLPPEYQPMLNPTDPMTVEMFTRLQSLQDAEGNALIEFFGKATAEEIAAFRAFMPEVALLLDIFDDGQINESVGAEAGGGMDDGPMPTGPAPMNRPPMAAEGPVPTGGGGGSPWAGEESEEEEEEAEGPPPSRLSSIRA